MKVLSFFGLIDHHDNLSLTALILYAVIVKILMAPIDAAAVALLLPVVLNYMHKRYDLSRSKDFNGLDTKVGVLELSVKSAFNEINELVVNNKKIMDQSAEVEKILKTHNLMSLLNKR
jgi:hypothetical protein